MAEVAVFVDDAVLGNLPPVCAKDGVPATCQVRFTEEVGRSNRLGILWLLVFAGPLGWVVLLFLASRDNGERLTVRIPYSDGAFDRFVSARRLRARAWGFGAASVVGLLLLTVWAGLGPSGAVLTFAALGVALAASLVGEWRIGQSSVAIDLDASRRWVTLRGVHSAFAAAYRATSSDTTETNLRQ